jgi:hypothetical protein
MSLPKRLLVLAVLLATACAGATPSQVLIPPARAAVGQRWEHFCFLEGNASGVNDANQKLGEAGQQGWELVSVATPTSRSTGGLDAVET